MHTHVHTQKKHIHTHITHVHTYIHTYIHTYYTHTHYHDTYRVHTHTHTYNDSHITHIHTVFTRVAFGMGYGSQTSRRRKCCSTSKKAHPRVNPLLGSTGTTEPTLRMTGPYPARSPTYNNSTKTRRKATCHSSIYPRTREARNVVVVPTPT